MKQFTILLLCLLFAAPMFGQAIAKYSEITKTKKDGMEYAYHDGSLFTGFLIEHYDDGKPKSWVTMKDGLPEGHWQEWYPNGRLKYSANWKQGKGHGLWEYFHENGVIRQLEFYNMDIPMGIFRDHYNNGQLKQQSNWLNGKKEGVWTYYDEAGRLTKTEVYENNELLSTSIAP